MPAVGQRVTDYTVINLNSIIIVYVRKTIPSEDGLYNITKLIV